MPAANRSKHSCTKKPDLYSNHIDSDNIQVEEEPRVGRKKTRNAAAKQPTYLDNAEESVSTEQMGQQPLPPANPQSILGHLKQTFPQNKRQNDSSDALNEVDPTQKVSDEHTPPTNVWARSAGYGQSPPVDPIPGFSVAGTPPYEPGFNARGGFTRSPPISPPLRKARPVSYGSGIPPLPSHHRVSTSPYAYAANAYGSPPALPHLPQQHFYGPHDVDIGLANVTAQMNLKDPVPLKFAHVPGYGNEAREAVFVTGEGELNVLGYNGDKLEHSGCLRGMQGAILDVCLLTWNSGNDPFAEYRPLVALTIHGPGNPEGDSAEVIPQDAGVTYLETKVVVYSMSKSCRVADLLHVPSTMRMFHGGIPLPGPAANLKTHASGNFLVISSGDSGELFVFSVRKDKESAVFECLGKYWTTVQPQLQRRDSSQPASEADISPADLGRGIDGEGSSIFSMNGRWLAFCPASTPSRRSIGALLGEYVVHNKNSPISAGTAPSRPPVTCDVDSTDVDTFFAKVAKGFAQEAVRSAKWIGEKGVQTWQNYWKKDSSADNLPHVPSSSPPVYSPHHGVAQFPPTHAIDIQTHSKDPEVISILDLKSLQESQGRRIELNAMATFQPPGGCSFLSFTPTGLSLLTANRKGDVQYVWDLQQMRHIRISATSTPPDSGCVRQVARYERLSPSTIVDVIWDGSTGYRFALLTKNRTVHIFDLPKTAFQWPPPLKKNRPMSAPVEPPQTKAEHEPAPSGGFFASAMTIAGRTQPMLANLRGRAPSISSGITGFGASGIGLASTTSMRSGRAVAAGLSKSLGAATETVTSLRHANQSRLYLKVPARVGLLCWQRRDGKSVLSVLDSNSIKSYYVRMTKPRVDRQRHTVSVFDARKPVATKLPKALELLEGQPHREADTPSEDAAMTGFWRSPTIRGEGLKMSHPLASAEIETNAPYQPFHSDHRVTISLIEGKQLSVEHLSTIPAQQRTASQRTVAATAAGKWVFGREIQSHQVPSTVVRQLSDEDGSTIYHGTKITSDLPILGTTPVESPSEGVSHAVGSTKKRKNKKIKSPPLMVEDDGFGEADLNMGLRKDRIQDLLEDEDFMG
ncbi:hypothetical protein LTR20_009393 [Exophiala xenobiotica]|nr:hypothetical protein LTR40_003548 [Exophiala xenobiotica]KAK5361813.1 hypothetical protein LTS13_009814 [Exophiala xenobiotica]KAK5393231.1 hypothetical protein LTR79_009545 [Exophiala xenobiotica]KAK5408137.1 hypothetical protein LTR90_009593 [Exophiala xenobiotica]KAK5456452.1 hypothetical protein LTR20_009393 [Exophiala xenobiotica]